MYIPLESIFIPPDENGRIREAASLAEAVSERANSIIANGQLQPILVERLAVPVDGREWKLIDGQVRYVSLLSLNYRLEKFEPEINMAFKRWGIQPGMIEAKEINDIDPITALAIEYNANEDSTAFTWNEKGRYVRRIHEMLVERAKGQGEKWTAEKTAEFIGRSKAFVSTYLELTDESDELVQAPAVQNARSRQTAKKQLDIERARHQRKLQAKADSVRSSDVAATGVSVRYEDVAKMIAHKGDCRDWIKTIPDNVFDWFHWDPPYGGSEGIGGAFAGHKPIQTSLRYCLGLMEVMIPEIWRTMREGAWLAFWYTPVHYNWVRLLLQGHKFDHEGNCAYCFKNAFSDHDYLSNYYYCTYSPNPFWVNPYPNQWYKEDRVADGHEITRFLAKQTEPFFLAGKILPATPKDVKLPILQISNRGNVFTHDIPRGLDRRHVNHKPPALLKEILSLISVPGSLGGDASGGSGSIIEAASEAGRKVLVAELDDTHWQDCYSVALEHCRRLNVRLSDVAEWLVP